MQTDALIDTLVADLGPVRPHSRVRMAALVGIVVVVETLLFLCFGEMRPDMRIAMATPAFWWKSGSFMAIALLAAAAMLVSLEPGRPTPRLDKALWRALAIVVPVVMALGWLIDAGAAGRSALSDRLAWRDGIECLATMAVLSLPLVIAFGVLVRRGASTQPARTAFAAGLAAAGFGAFVFAFHCPHDDPLYVAVWYGGAVAVLAGLARLAMPRLVRW